MRVAVVGGGIGGLATALALQAPGREIVVFEQAEALGDVGAGVQLSPNAVRALRALGVEAALRPRVVAPEAIELRRARDDRLLIRSALNQGGSDAPYWHARRSDLQGVLAEAVRVRGAAELRLGAHVSRVAVEDDRVRLETGAGGEHAFDLLIAADGVRSAVRTALLGTEAPRYTGALAWRGTVPLASLDPAQHPPVAAVRVGAGRHFVSYRVGGGAVNFVGVVRALEPAGESWEQGGDPTALARDFEGWPDAVTRLISACGSPRRWALYDRDPAPRWSSGPAVLLGDAAHPIPPHLAQGAALALEDAVVLARTLAGWPVLEALRRYEGARRGRAARVLAASRRQARLLQLGGGAAALAHAGLKIGGAAAPGVLTRSLGWLYDYDPTTASL